jgi:hypothetical protein
MIQITHSYVRWRENEHIAEVKCKQLMYSSGRTSREEMVNGLIAPLTKTIVGNYSSDYVYVVLSIQSIPCLYELMLMVNDRQSLSLPK